ncbi:MAG: hypothetical protein GY797_39155 [Deltaproteobacteria bacterium]|nr:hypothetical protein [Deltaproteobacteria bacterium]
MKLTWSWNWLIFVNLILGLFLWLLFSTDYSLIGTIPDILFPPLVAIIAVVSLALINIHGRFQKFLVMLAHLPSIIGGCLYILIAFIMLIPPFTLGTMFMMSEITEEIQIQEAISPNSTKVANVYFRGVGAYSGGNGRIYVRIKYRNVPFLERDVFHLGRSLASEESINYVKWIDDDTLYVTEVDNEVAVGAIGGEIPQVIALPYMIFQFASVIVEQQIATYRLTVPVHDIPIYPGKITGDQWQYIEEESTVFRSFNVERENVDEIAKWYEETLAKPPWVLERVNHYTYSEYGEVYIYHCIQATHKIDDEQRVYFWEFMGGNDISVHINVGTPYPITDTCRRFVKIP